MEDVEALFELKNVILLTTKFKQELKITYEKVLEVSSSDIKRPGFPNSPQILTSSFQKIFTLYNNSDATQMVNISYVMHNFEHREYMIRFKRGDAYKRPGDKTQEKFPSQKFRLFTDNSAFNIERIYN